MNGVCDAVHFAVGANEASPAITQLRRTGAIDAPHLPNFVCIWSLLVGLTKCACVWPIARARAIYQTLRIWSNAERLTNWPNALRDCPNAQIGQMRLTMTHAKMSYCYMNA